MSQTFSLDHHLVFIEAVAPGVPRSGFRTTEVKIRRLACEKGEDNLQLEEKAQKKSFLQSVQRLVQFLVRHHLASMCPERSAPLCP